MIYYSLTNISYLLALVNSIRFATKYDLMLHTGSDKAKLGFNLFMATGYPSNMLVIGDYSEKRWRDSLKDLDDADVMVRVLNHESLHYVLYKWAGKDRGQAKKLNHGLDEIISRKLTRAFDQAMVLLGRNGLFQYIEYAVSKDLYDDFLGV